MVKQHKIILATLVFVALLVLALTFSLKYQKSNEILEETVAVFSNEPNEQPYSDLLGNPVSLDKYLGKAMVVQTWASWSPFSQADLLILDNLAKSYSSEQVVFMAINRKENKEQALRYLNTIPQVTDAIVVLDPRDRFYSAVGGYAMPETVIYNQKGEIVKHFRGLAPEEEIKAVLTEITSN